MNQPKSILVATDLSEASEPALRTGAAYARHFGAKLALIHSFDPAPFVAPVAVPGPGDVMQSLMEDTQQALRKELEEVQQKVLADSEGKLEVEHVIVRHPVPWQAVVEEAERRKVDLIVVGSHGRTGIKRVLLGSIAERVARHASCDVLVCRSDS